MNQRPKLERTKTKMQKGRKVKGNLYYDRFSNGSLNMIPKSTSNKRKYKSILSKFKMFVYQRALSR